MGILGAMIAGGASGGASSVRNSIKEQREKALIKLAQKHQKSMQDDQFSFTADQNEQAQEHRAGMQDDSQEFSMSMQEDQQEYGAGQNELDRNQQASLQEQRLDHAEDMLGRKMTFDEEMQVLSFEQDKDLRLLIQDFQAEEGEKQRDWASGESVLDRTFKADLQDDSQEYGSTESQLTRDHQADMQGDRLDLQGWQSGVNDAGETSFFNLNNDESKSPDDFSFPRAPSSVAFGNTSPGLMVAEWQNQRDYLADRLKDGMVPEGEAAQIKTRIYDLESKISGVLGFDSQDNVALDLGDSLVGDSASPDADGSAPPPRGGSAPPPKGGSSVVNPTTPEAYDQQLDNRSAKEAAAKQEQSTADGLKNERKQVISQVSTLIENITEEPDRGTIRKRLIEARQKIADTWTSRDDWTEDDLEALKANWSALHKLENQFGVPK